MRCASAPRTTIGPCGAWWSAAGATTLTARAENHLVGRPDLKDTIKRLQAYQEAGADVLYAPGLSIEDSTDAAPPSVVPSGTDR